MVNMEYGRRRNQGPDPGPWFNEIGEMLESGKYDFAVDYLNSVLTQIENEEFITERQIIGIENIRDSIG